MSDLCAMSATAMAVLLRSKELSAREVVDAHLAQIERVNPRVNAFVTVAADRARTAASAADDAIAKKGPTGILHGLPVAHKDLFDTAGIRTTRGSPFFRDHVPSSDALIVARARAAGAITIGKTNTPEFGAGSQTFNTIFGATRNPFDPHKTAGGSSGGSAAALACRMVPLADGTDVGGSLRNPAAFCNVVGFRPSPGRVPNEQTSWSPIPVSGPMARTVTDVALFLTALAGPESRYPLSLSAAGDQFGGSLEQDVKGRRIAWWTGLGGVPFEPEIVRIANAARTTFHDLGCIVDEAEPDFEGVDQAFTTLRYIATHAQHDPLVRERPEWVKDTIRFEVEQATRLTGADVGRALARQARMFDETRRFFERYDYFILPTTQVEPFDVDIAYPTEIDGRPLPTYIDWMRSCWYVTMMAAPAISVPAGFAASGLPVGLQIVGPPRDDRSVLQLAYAFEQATRYADHLPPAIKS